MNAKVIENFANLLSLLKGMTPKELNETSKFIFKLTTAGISGWVIYTVVTNYVAQNNENRKHERKMEDNKQKYEHDKQKYEHEECMARLEIEKMRAEKEVAKE